MKPLILGILGTLLVMGCTTTPQGKSLDRANYADLGSTGLTLALVDGAAEANPLGLVLLPMKLGMGWGLEQYTDNCYKRAEITKWWNTMYYGAAANNLSILVGAAGMAAPAVGVAGGVLYYIFREDVEPDTFTCVPEPYQKLAQMYTEGNLEMIEEVYTEDAVDGEMVGHAALRERYAEFFGGTEDRQLVFLNEEYMGARIGDLWWHYRYSIVMEGEKISRFDYEWVPLEEVMEL